MSENIYKINTTLKMANYLVIVDDIVEGFFSVDGSYQPELGRFNAIRNFYNACVVEGNPRLKDGIVTAEDLEIALSDECFCKEFNLILSKKNDNSILDFACAYKDAMDIVETKKSSLTMGINTIKNLLITFAEKVAPIVTEENIEKIFKITDSISNGEVNTGSLIKSYAENFKKNKEDKEDILPNGKVVSIRK